MIDHTGVNGMTHRRIRSLLQRFVLVLAAAVVPVGATHAETWPDKPIKFVVAAPAGSSLDVLARLIGEKLKDRLGQPVVVDNRPAAGGRDNGPPGLRPHYHANYYGAFVLDPDGHNIEAVCHTAE